MLCEVEQRRHLASVRQGVVALHAELVKERMCTGLERCDPGAGRVLEQQGHQVDSFCRSAYTENLDKGHQTGLVTGVFLGVGREQLAGRDRDRTQVRTHTGSFHIYKDIALIWQKDILSPFIFGNKRWQ